LIDTTIRTKGKTNHNSQQYRDLQCTNQSKVVMGREFINLAGD